MSRTKKSPSTLPHGRKLADFKPLLPAEQKLLKAVAIGEMCWLCDEDNPQRPDIFTEQNEIRAPFIRFLALGGDHEAFVHEKGVQVAGAFVGGELDFISCQNISPLTFHTSFFLNSLKFQQAKLASLRFTECYFKDFYADGMVLDENLFLFKQESDGVISLLNSKINGSLALFGSNLTSFNAENIANSPDPNITLGCDFSVIRGDVRLSDGFSSRGQVRFIGAEIQGAFVCEDAHFEGLNEYALLCDHITIEKKCTMQNASFIGGVSFIGARIKGRVTCRSSKYSHFSSIAIHFENSQITTDALLSNNFHAEGEVRFKNAQIGGDFICENDSSIKHPRNTENPKGHALHCGGIRVGGNVLLRQNTEDDSKLEINGSVNFMDARIGKGFECSHAEISHFVPSDKGSEIAAYALNLQGADIGGILTMKKADIYGSISLLKAHVDSLNDDEASWPQPAIEQKSGIIRKIKGFFCAISDRLKPKPQDRTAIFNENKAEPENQEDEEEEQEEKDSLQSVESDDSKPAAPPEYDVSRPQNHGALASVLSLDGFTYNQFAGNAPTKAETRLKWLMLQKPSALWTNFRPQPFEQLTKVLRNTGYEEQATQLLIQKYDHKQDVRIAQAKGFFASLWAWLLSLFFSFFLGLLTGYGKRPARVFGLLLTLWASAAFWYHQAAQQDVFAPSHPLIFLKYDQKPDCRMNWVHCIENANPNHNPEFQAYTVFSPLLYSLDVMLPILNLHQEGDWGPKMKALKILGVKMPPASTWFVMWSQIILGWLGSFMLIAMLSGWMQKE